MWTKVKKKIALNAVVWYNKTILNVGFHKSTVHNNNQ